MWLRLTWRAVPSRCPEERGLRRETFWGFSVLRWKVLVVPVEVQRASVLTSASLPCFYAPHPALSFAFQPIRRLRPRDNGLNLMPVTENRWDALSVCHRSAGSVGKCFSWGGHGKVFWRLWHAAKTQRLETRDVKLKKNTKYYTFPVKLNNIVSMASAKLSCDENQRFKVDK